MNSSGDAAEQVVRLSLEGTEVALKLSGAAAKNIAAALYTILKNKDKTKTAGHQRLAGMLKSGKELKVFSLPEEHLRRFTREAKRYGVVYCALRGKDAPPDGLTDIMVRAEDAAKINRIVERFKLATVDTASIKHEIEKTRAEKEKAESQPAPDKGVQEKAEVDQVLDDLLGVPKNKEAKEPANPTAARTEKSPPSAPISEMRSKAAEGTAKVQADRPSVREELREIKAARKEQEAAMPVREDAPKKKEASPKMNEHIRPPQKKKPKAKGR